MTTARKQRTGDGAVIFRDCLARQAGACGGTPATCLECSPVHQALRAASWVLQRWPRISARRLG